MPVGLAPLDLHKKCRNTEFFLVDIFLYSDEVGKLTSVFSPNTGKYRPNNLLDTFHTVWIVLFHDAQTNDSRSIQRHKIHA